MKSFLCLIISFSLCHVVLYAQTECTGNFGDNIFDAGGFGRGEINVLQDDPGYAPGYTYTRSPPPMDGFYTITNNTGEWNLFPGWMSIINSSSDEKGYMMVVNASVDPGIFYEQQIEGLCENTTYRFSADIINLISPSWDELIKPRVSFLINDDVQYDTGNIPQNGNWNIYGFNFATGPGETSLKLSLRNNAPGGVGNDLAIDNIFFRPCGPEALILPRTPANICEDGDPIPLVATINGDEFENPVIQWQQSFDEGATWQDMSGERDISILHSDLRTGDYYYRYYLANSESSLANEKCRIISNIKIVRVNPKEFVVQDSFCAGTTYQFGNTSLSIPGFYTDSLISSIGCDSIVFLTLTEMPVGQIGTSLTAQDVSCNGASDASLEVRVNFADYPPTVISLGAQAVTTGLAVFFDLAAGEYDVHVRDRFGCMVKEGITITEPPELTLEVGEDQDLLLGAPIVIQPIINQPFTKLQWSGSLSGSCDDLSCFPLELIPISDATIFWTVEAAPGCLALDTLQVTVQATRSIFIPNAFSPDSDGRNDHFSVFGRSGEINVIRMMRIFDRWGTLVYEGENLPVNTPEAGWDGRANGNMVPQGVYAYQVVIEFLDGVIETKTGSVMLVY